MREFSNSAKRREYWQRKSAYYYRAQYRYFNFLVPPGASVLEIGCGIGDLLGSLSPRRGVGIDNDPALVAAAKSKHPHHEFLCMDAANLSLGEKFDVVILTDVIAQLDDVQSVFDELHKVCHESTRIIVGYYNMAWSPLLKLAELLGQKMPQKEINWLSTNDVSNLLYLANFETIKVDRRILFPKYLPLLSSFLNRFVATLPILRNLCLNHYVLARLIPPPEPKQYSVSVVIACRNEKGHIEDGLRRLPEFGSALEIIFVDGHSTDGTPNEIRRMIKCMPDKKISLLTQDGSGKGDAVRKGFDHATGDLLMILDADLTVPPEQLPKFYDAISQNKGEFINGSRLVYPMEHQAMRFLNLIGNKFFALAFSWLLDQPLKDTLCGTKVLLKKDYERIVSGRSYFGEFDPFGDFDLLFGASKLNLKIVEVPIRYKERMYGTTNISRFRHGWLLLKMTVYAFFKLKAI
jgi:SAM-dependent methyltransferase